MDIPARSIQVLERVFFPALSQTLHMLVVSTITSSFFGILLALILILTDDDGLKPNRLINRSLSIFINLIRSVPFIILIISVIPLTRLVVGTSIGPKAAIFCITIAASPMICRLVEASFREINRDLITAAKALGANDWQILYYVIIKESVPGVLKNLTVAVITVLNTTAQAGIVGAGGLGSVALAYGYQNYDYIVMYSILIVLILFVQILQFSGDKLYHKAKYPREKKNLQKEERK